MLGLGLGLFAGARGNGLPALPDGFAYLIDSDGNYLVDPDGSYLIGAL